MSDKDKLLAPEHMRQAVIYRPDLFGDFIFVKGSDYMIGAKLQPLLDRLESQAPGFEIRSVVFEGKDGLIFGSSDPEAHAKLLNYFGIVREASVAVGIVHPKVLGSTREGPRLRYPFHTLMNVGDHFLVKNGDRQTVSTYATNYKKYVVPDKIIKCSAVPGGIMVMLMYVPGVHLGDEVSP